MLPSLRVILAPLALLALSSLAAAAAPLSLGSLEIDNLWTQAVPPGAPTASAYFTIQNRGNTPDRLIAVSSREADHGEVHEMSMTGGIMQMRPVARPLEIPPGGKVVLSPQGFHVMLVGLKTRPIAGGTFPIRLTFEKAGEIDAVLTIVPIGAQGPPANSGAR